MTRKAGEGMLQRIKSALEDNALTQSWANSVDRFGVRPLEGMIAKEVDREVLPGLVRNNVNSEGYASRELLELLKSVSETPDGVEAKVERLRNLAMQRDTGDLPEGGVRELVGNALHQSLGSVPLTNEILSPLTTGSSGLTQWGNVLRNYGPGGPVAAYSGVTAGGALGTKALMDLVSYLQQGEGAESSEVAVY